MGDDDSGSGMWAMMTATVTTMAVIVTHGRQQWQ